MKHLITLNQAQVSNDSHTGSESAGRATFGSAARWFLESAPEHPGMAHHAGRPTPGRILLPVDLARCPLEAFSFLNTFAGRRQVTVTLLNVINLNAWTVENRIFSELAESAKLQLEWLAETLLNPGLSFRTQVRFGKPAQEIVAEAKEANMDLIVLTSYGARSVWRRRFRPRIVAKILQDPPCDATLLRVRTQVSCGEGYLVSGASARLATVDLEISA